MALGTPTLATPTVGASTTNVTTASFIPTGSALLLAGCGSRASVPLGALGVSGGSLTWTELAQDLYDAGAGRNRCAVFAAVAPGSPSSMTVQATSASATKVNLAVVQITGHAGIPGNVDSGNDAVGDPATVLPLTPAANSTVILFGSFNGSVAVGTPGGFTELTTLTTADLILHCCFDAGSASASAAYSTTNNPSTAIAIEVTEAAAGGAGIRLRRRGSRFQHMLVR